MQSNLQKLHLAIIMDGNGRWAQKRNLPRFKGHCAGVNSLRTIIQACPEFHISMLTIYAFSSDNWKRPKSEISHLMDLLRLYLTSELDVFLKNKIRFMAIGRRDRLPEDVVELIEDIETQTKNETQLTLRIALDYSARYEILQIAQKNSPALKENHSSFSRALSGLDRGCDVDLLIRTSGEKRLSDFLLWECAYSELHFTDTDWPDFSKENLKIAVDDFRSRNRRFGSLEPENSPNLISTEMHEQKNTYKTMRTK